MPNPAGPGTNKYNCHSCGRHFNTPEELRAHEPECRAAKDATGGGRRELREQDEPHLPNDQESEEHPFQHGTG
jgi:hypothetical protein